MLQRYSVRLRIYSWFMKYCHSKLGDCGRHRQVTLVGANSQKCLWAFLTLNRIWIPQAHRITVVALHVGVFQGIVFFLREALWQRVS